MSSNEPVPKDDLVDVKIPRDLVWVVARVLDWRKHRRFGRLTFAFQNGKPGHVEDGRVEKAPLTDTID